MRDLSPRTTLRLRDWREAVDREQAARYAAHRLRAANRQLRATVRKMAVVGLVLGASIGYVVAVLAR
jgi:hypothetical protein